LCILCGFICTISGLLFPFVDDYRLCILILWIVLYCGAVILPIMTSNMLSSVQIELRP
jgi:hypothetical protein